ncbi:glycerol kinase GlpK [Reinekea forsetii]|nr:glycerol kinase GlpK [Reinekea forsetii]
MTDYILSIDQGTTSSRAILFNRDGELCATSQQEFPQHFPNDGWVEHEPDDIWSSVLSTCQGVIKQHNISANQIAAIGISNQRETTMIWDRTTGEPIHRAIVWQDRRTAATCSELESADSKNEQIIKDKTGLLIDPYFSATKISWILDNVSGAREKAERGELAFGTVDTFLIWKLTNGASHTTDATNAARTSLFNIHTQQWDDDLLSLFNVPKSILPTVLDSSANFGTVDPQWFGESICIGGVAGDQHAALFGQACFEAGMAKSTYGTGCFLMLNTGKKALSSQNRLLTTVAYRLNGEVTYALEGSIFAAGTTIQWLRDGLKLIGDAKETEALALQTPSEHGVYLVPAFIGLGAPYWDPNARGAIFGLTRDTGIKEIVTAGLQSVAYQTKDLQKAMELDGVRPTALRVDGGMVANNWLMQFLSDMLGATVDRPTITETSALGAAQLAGLQVGFYDSLSQLSDLWQRDRLFEPSWAKEKRDTYYDGWLESIEKVKQGETSSL